MSEYESVGQCVCVCVCVCQPVCKSERERESDLLSDHSVYLYQPPVHTSIRAASTIPRKKLLTKFLSVYYKP